MSPTSPGTESEATAPFSTNGSGAIEPGGESSTDHADDGATFLADLARAMKSTASAEQTHNAEGTEQRRQAHIDAIRAREALEAEELRELAKEDVKGIDAWSDGEIKRVKLERERRIASRREQLQIRLEEHRSVVAREVEAVEAAIASYRLEIERYFERLELETDPIAIAQSAGNRPPFPILELIGPDDAPSAKAAAAATTTAYAPAVTQPYASVAPVVEEPISHDEPPAAEAEPPAAEAEPVSQAELVSHDEPVSQDEAVSHDEPPPDEQGAPPAETPMVGVMDAEVATHEIASPWASTPEPVAMEAEVVEPPAHETVEAPVNEGSEPSGDAYGSEEPVAAVAEARVVMPRPTGAGSWLRWPSSSADHTDSDH